MLISRYSEIYEKYSMGGNDEDIGKKRNDNEKVLKLHEKNWVVTSDALAIAYVLSCFGHAQVCAILRGKYVTFQNHGWFIQTRILMDFMEHLEDVENAQQGSSAHYRLSLVKERLICQAIRAGLGG
jgi:hypothetical protein